MFRGRLDARTKDAVEFLQQRVRIVRKHGRSQARKRLVRVQILRRKIRKRIHVALHRRKIAPRQRPCPCRTRPDALQIIQRLARQRQQRPSRLPARETLGHQQARGRLHQRQHVRACKRSSCMIRRLVCSRQADRNAAHLPNHFSRDFQRGGIAINAEHHARQDSACSGC